MNVREMEEREDYAPILAETLAQGWTEWLGRETRVSFAATAGQRWYFLPLLGGYVTADTSPRVLAWLRDAFRNTPVRRRQVPQFVLGTALALGPVARRVARPAFTVDPPVPGAREVLVVPGNQRARVFDFAQGLTRVFAKAGFDRHGLANEIRVRADAAGPFPPVLAHAPDAAWLEEPILEGWSLPRCPFGFDRAALSREALRLLAEWSAADERTVEAADYADTLRRRVIELAGAVGERFDEPLFAVERWADRLATEATRAGQVVLARTHGDFQPGNILVRKADRGVSIIDWEHSAVRSRDYDRLVFGLRTRSGGDLARRLRDFRAGRTGVAPADPSARAAVLALLVLEELAFYLSESLTGPYRQLPSGLRGYLRALSELGTGLGGLFG